MYQSTITLFINEWRKQMDKTMRELNKMDLFTTISHINGTNAVKVFLKSPIELPNAVAKIKEIPNISQYYTQPDHLKEVSDAIENHEFFKAFTLCSSLYESFGTNILIKHFKENLSLNSDKLEKLGVVGVIIMLYTHRLIAEGTYSDMISVNSLRNDLVHDYLVSLSSEKIQKRLKENIPKITRSLKKLDEINERMSKK